MVSNEIMRNSDVFMRISHFLMISWEHENEEDQSLNGMMQKMFYYSVVLSTFCSVYIFFLCYNPLNYTYLPSFFQFSVKTHEMSWSWTLPWIITLNFQSPLRRQEEHHWHSKIWTNQKPHQFFHTSILLLFHSSQSLGFGLDKMVCIRETKTRAFLRVKIKLHGLKIKSM